MPVTQQIIEIVTRFTDKATAGVKKLNGALAAHNIRVKDNVSALGGFNFSWLSVMFAGMAVYRVFGGILKQQMELWGIMEGFSAMLTVIMLPAMEWLSDLLWPILEFFMDLPEPIQKLIGFGIIFAAVLGLILMTAGMVMLALFGIIPIVGALAGPFIVIGAIIAGLALIVTGVVMIVKGKLEGIGIVIMGIGVILLLFIGWWALIPIAIGLIVYFVIKHWTKIKEFLGRVFSAIGGFFKKWFWDKPKEWITKIWEFIKNIFNKIWGVFKKVFEYSPLGMVMGLLGGFQAGGIVPKTGAYLLHEGETVTPAGATTFAPTITVYATVSSDYDVRKMADALKKYWVADYERTSQGRAL